MAGSPGVRVHPTAINESDRVGEGTRIWAFAHVMPGAAIGRDCNVGDHCFIEGGAAIGNGVTVKNGVCVWEGVTLEDFVFVGPNAAFTNDLYPRSPRFPAVRERYASKGWLVPTRVETGATIGANATVLCGVTVGRFAVVGAGALVARDVPAHAIVAGCPARPVGAACECGQRLRAAGPEAFACAACGLRYARRPGGLEKTA